MIPTWDLLGIAAQTLTVTMGTQGMAEMTHLAIMMSPVMELMIPAIGMRNQVQGLVLVMMIPLQPPPMTVMTTL